VAIGAALGAIGVLAWALRKRSASLRHALWVCAVLLIPFLPVLDYAATHVDLPRAQVRVRAVALPATAEPVVWPGQPPDTRISPLRFSEEPPLLQVYAQPWALVAVVYGLCLLRQLGWFGVGLFRVRQWVRRALPVTEARVLKAFDLARERLGINRAVAVLESGDAPTALTVGVRKSLVLLPKRDVESLTESDIQKVALHECAHVRRHDTLWLRLMLLVRTVFFFQPLVWWGCRRAAILAEEACDDAVVATTGEALPYADLLTRQAERYARPSISTSMATGLLFNRSAFVSRVAAIIDETRSRARRPSRLVLGVTALAALLCVMLAVAAPLNEEGGPGTFSVGGMVVDKDGNPLADAQVYASTFDRAQQASILRAETRTDETGRFYFDGLKAEQNGGWSCGLHAWKPGYAWGSEGAGYLPQIGQSPEKAKGAFDVEIKLLSPVVFAGRVLDREGKPIVGARISPMFELPDEIHGQTEPYFVTPGGRSFGTLVTDREGRFRLDGAPAGTRGRLEVLADGYGMIGINSYFRGYTGELNPDRPFFPVDGTEVEIRLGPESRILGTLVEAKSGKPLADIPIWVFEKDDLAEAFPTTDAAGRFVIRGIPAGTYRISARVPPENSFRSRVATVQVAEGEVREGLELKAEEGVRVVGRVLDGETGKPVERAGVHCSILEERIGAADSRTDSDGEYHFVLLPGTYDIGAQREGYGYGGQTAVIEAEGQEEVRLPDIVIGPAGWRGGDTVGLDDGERELLEGTRPTGEPSGVAANEDTQTSAPGMKSTRLLFEATDDDLAGLSERKDVLYVVLNGCIVTDDGLAQLKDMTWLKSLRIERCPRITGAGLAYLKGMEQLSSLDLDGTPITDAALSQLREMDNLSQLDLSRTAITDAGLVNLRGMKGLRDLRIQDTKVTDRGLAALQGIPSLARLSLSDALVTGTGVAHLRAMPRLSDLRLHGRNLTDAMLARVSSLRGLRTLSLGDAGSVTDQGIARLGELTALRELDLSGTGVTDEGLAKLAGLEELRVLRLNSTRITDAGVREIRKFTHLRRLGLCKTPITDAAVDDLSEMNELIDVVLYDTQLSEVALDRLRAALPNASIISVRGRSQFVDSNASAGATSPHLTNASNADLAALKKEILQLVVMGGTVTDDGLAPLKEMKWLKTLVLRCPQVTGAGLVYLEGMEQLSFLDLEGAPITDDALDYLKDIDSLSRLNLSRTGITDAGLGTLKAMKGLGTLEIRDTKVTERGLATLEKMPFLSSLGLDGALVTDTGAKHLKAMPELRMLRLSGPEVTDATLARLNSLTGLWRLTLRNCGSVTDDGVAELRDMAALQHLDLSGTRVTDAGLAKLTGLKDLRVLYLTDTGITDAGVREIRKFTHLQRLELCSTPITDAAVDDLSELKELAAILLYDTRLSEGALARLRAALPNAGIYNVRPAPGAAVDPGRASLPKIDDVRELGQKVFAAVAAGRDAQAVKMLGMDGVDLYRNTLELSGIRLERALSDQETALLVSNAVPGKNGPAGTIHIGLRMKDGKWVGQFVEKSADPSTKIVQFRLKPPTPTASGESEEQLLYVPNNGHERIEVSVQLVQPDGELRAKLSRPGQGTPEAVFLGKGEWSGEVLAEASVMVESGGKGTTLLRANSPLNPAMKDVFKTEFSPVLSAGRKSVTIGIRVERDQVTAFDPATEQTTQNRRAIETVVRVPLDAALAMGFTGAGNASDNADTTCFIIRARMAADEATP
jgi:beta-lactamase regulating signal transducer with metallopeptidase domain/Leucine-rich repeat (LRR) protein